MDGGTGGDPESGEEVKRVEYWCFVPNAVDLLPATTQRSWAAGPRDVLTTLQQDCSIVGPRYDRTGGPDESSDQRINPIRPRVVYYCADDWSKFKYLDGAWIQRREEELLGRADVVFAASRYLEEKCRAIASGRVHYMAHGVEHAKFASALSSGTTIPEDVGGLPKPVIGFYGNVYPWIDFDLLESLVKSRPGWSFVMIGSVFCDIARFDSVPNVHFLGRREHDCLPAYCRAFDASIIPYDMTNPRMQSVNPVKTRELLAAGVPIVASDVPELRNFGDNVSVCKGVDEWLKALDTQVRREDREAVSASVAGDDWSARVADIRRIVSNETVENSAMIGG